jgi:hypothetical protein
MREKDFNFKGIGDLKVKVLLPHALVTLKLKSFSLRHW